MSGGQVDDNPDDATGSKSPTNGYSHRCGCGDGDTTTSTKRSSSVSEPPQLPNISILSKVHLLPIDVDNTDEVQDKAFKVLRKCKNSGQVLRKGTVLDAARIGDDTQFVVAG